jgi:hypothetical protein
MEPQVLNEDSWSTIIIIAELPDKRWLGFFFKGRRVMKNRLSFIIKSISILFVFSLGVVSIIGSGGGGGDTIVLGGYILLEDDTPVEEVEVVFVWPGWLGDWEVVLLTDETGWYGYESKGQFPENSVTITPNDPNYEFSPIGYDLRDIREKNIYDLDFVAMPK